LASEVEAYGGPPRHISRRSRAGIRFVLDRFRSPLLTVSQLISLPPPTRMLYFGGFPFLAECPLRDRSSDSEIGGSKVPCAYPPLIAAWHVLRRRPSRAIPQLTGVSYTEYIGQASRTRVIGVIGPRRPLPPEGAQRPGPLALPRGGPGLHECMATPTVRGTVDVRPPRRDRAI
jgi:hypothetical protein